MDFVGSPNFSPARHSTNGSRRSRPGSRASSLDHRLSIIAEDSNTPLPPLPSHQPHNRPFSRRFLGEPPRYSGHAPPKYSLWDVTGPKGEKFDDLRNNRFVAQRGGWKRICLIAILVIVCIIALAIGLGVGLKKKHSRYFFLTLMICFRNVTNIPLAVHLLLLPPPPPPLVAVLSPLDPTPSKPFSTLPRRPALPIAPRGNANLQ